MSSENAVGSLDAVAAAEAAPTVPSLNDAGLAKGARRSKKPVAAVAAPAAQRGLAAFAPELASALLESAGAHRPAVASRVPIERCVESTENARRSYDEKQLESLAASILAEGLQNPVHVIPRGDYFQVVQGHRRLRAYQILHAQHGAAFAEIPAFVREDLARGDPSDAAVAAAIENVQRVDLTPYEEALAYREIQSRGLTQEQLAERVGVSVNTVRARLKLLELPEDLGRRVGEPGFSAQHAEVLLPLAGRPELLAAARKAIGRKDPWGKPLDVRSFAREVQGDLVAAGLATRGGYSTDAPYEVASRESFQQKTRKLERIAIGTGHDRDELIVDMKGYKEIVKAETDAWKAEPKKKLRTSSLEREQRDKDAVFKEARKAARDSVAKAAKAIQGFGGRERGAIALALLKRANVGKSAGLIAEITGLPVAAIQKIDGYGSDKHLVELVDTLNRKKDDGQLLARLCVAAALYDQFESLNAYSSSAPGVLDHSLKTWTGTSWSSFKEKAKKTLAEKKKETKRKQPARAAKSAKKPAKRAPKKERAPVQDDSGDVEDDADLQDGDEE